MNTIVDYNIVSYCRSCKKRMVSKKGSNKSWYCPECYERIRSSKAREEAEKEEEEEKKK